MCHTCVPCNCMANMAERFLWRTRVAGAPFCDTYTNANTRIHIHTSTPEPIRANKQRRTNLHLYTPHYPANTRESASHTLPISTDTRARTHQRQCFIIPPPSSSLHHTSCAGDSRGTFPQIRRMRGRSAAGVVRLPVVVVLLCAVRFPVRVLSSLSLLLMFSGPLGCESG